MSEYYEYVIPIQYLTYCCILHQTPRAPLEAPKHPVDPVSPMRRPTSMQQQLSDGETSPDPIVRRPTYAVSAAGSTAAGRQASAPTSTTPSRRQTEVLSPKSVSPGSRPPWDSSKGDKPRRQSRRLYAWHVLLPYCCIFSCGSAISHEENSVSSFAPFRAFCGLADEDYLLSQIAQCVRPRHTGLALQIPVHGDQG